MKKTKRNSIKFFPGIFAIVMFALLIAVSIAVYTNQGYKKGVAITADSEAMFSSNLLEQIPAGNAEDQSQYKAKSISAVKDASTSNVSFTFAIYNYAPNAPNRVNPRDIDYDLTVSILHLGSDTKAEGFSVKDNNDNTVSFNGENTCTISNRSLKRDKAENHSFTVNMPESALNSGVQFAIKAVPQSGSLKATNNMGLAIIVTPVLSTGTSEATGWSGHWVEKTLAESDTSLIPSDCAAFNYELSGTGKGTVTLTWPLSLSIDPIFIEEITEEITGTVSSNSVAFKVDSDTKAVYKIRFYRTGVGFSDPYLESDFTLWPASYTFATPTPTPETTP